MKRIFLGIGGLVLLTVIVLLSWGLIEPTLLDEQEVEAAVPDLPPGWEGRKVAVLADWQIGLWGDNEGTVREAVTRIVELDPEAALIAGDFIYDTYNDLDRSVFRAARLAEPLTAAGIPTYAVLGNHDWGLSKKDGEPHEEAGQALLAALRDVGVQVLENEVAVLETEDGVQLHLVGLGSLWAGDFHPDVAFDGLPDDAPRVVMMHNPGGFPQIPADAAPFTVAGHTHGGQVRLPFLPETTWLSVAWGDKIHADAWVSEDYGQPGNALYVNRGIGMSMIPMRINAMPELTVFTLRRGNIPTASR